MKIKLSNIQEHIHCASCGKALPIYTVTGMNLCQDCYNYREYGGHKK